MAAQTVTARIGGSANFVEVTETLPAPFNTAAFNPIYLTPQWTYANGNSAVASAINQWFEPSGGPVTLAASASVTYTLTALTDALGRSISLAGGVRAWGLLVTSRTAGDYLTVGAAASNPWTGWGGGTAPTLKVFDFLFMGVTNTDKYTVTASSNEQLKVTNSGANSITFQLFLLGCLT